MNIQHSTPLSRERAFNIERPMVAFEPFIGCWAFDVFPLLRADSGIGAPRFQTHFPLGVLGGLIRQ
jgi:hypothetical protein